MQVILVAPNSEERAMLGYILKHAGLAIASSGSLERVASKWLERPSDLIVVARQTGEPLLPGLAKLRHVTQVPCICLVESITEDELCQLLQGGADLVLYRPVAPRVLAEYARALLRRTRTIPTSVLPELNHLEVQLDPDKRIVRVMGGGPRRLTQLEFRLLYVLMVNREQIVPVDTIVEQVWGYTGQGSRDLVRGLISRLRRKIEPNPSNPRFIHNLPGIGYSFTLDPED